MRGRERRRRGRRRRKRRRSVMEGGSTHESLIMGRELPTWQPLNGLQGVVISGCRERGQLRCDLCTHIQSH